MGARAGNRAGQDRDEVRPSDSIAVCAADEIVRARIEAALELAGYEPVLVCDSFEELIEEVRRTGPSLAVVGYAFEPFTPATELGPLRARLGLTPLVIVASGFSGAACRSLVPGGLEGLVQDSHIEDVLIPTIDAVLAEQLCVPASMRGTLAQPVFSHREKQVLELLLAGLTNGEIAAQLFLSESTVKSHLASSFRKLGVSSRTEAARCMLAPDSGLELRALSLTDHRPSLSTT
jgi:DNA-binding NarL/FixJ family response regulator